MVLISCAKPSIDNIVPNNSSPPMGWNSWNWFGKHEINEVVVKEVIDAMKEEGLVEAGYDIVVIDGGWRDTMLSPEGQLLAHPIKFPNGIKPLVDYAHSKGLKFGLHVVPGSHDCIGDPVGAYGREEVHVRQLVEWGVDFIKLDKCRLSTGWTAETVKDSYFTWRKLLDTYSDKPVILSVSAYEWYDWVPEIASMARTTEDITAKVAGMSGAYAIFDGELPDEDNPWGMLSVMAIAEENNKWAKFAGDGFWNDPDMLVVGDHGLTMDEQQSHFALWCLMTAPIMIGNDPRNMSLEEKQLLLNSDCIRINQDVTEQGRRVEIREGIEIWKKSLANNDAAVLLLNRDEIKERSTSIDLNELHLGSRLKIKDVFSKELMIAHNATLNVDIPANSSKFLLFYSEDQKNQ